MVVLLDLHCVHHSAGFMLHVVSRAAECLLHRRLRLQMGTADLSCTLHGKKHILTVTTHQMCVLMLLNDQPSMTFKELLEVRQLLAPLGCSVACCTCAVHTCMQREPLLVSTGSAEELHLAG